jgi:hypothetical protein
MAYTEVTRRGYGGRIKDSIKGILFGLILFFGSFVLIYWNESNTVKNYRTIAEARKVAVSLPTCETLDSASDGKLVHVNGPATTEDILADEVFGVSLKAIGLRRIAEMYQWDEDVRTETKTNAGGSETTTKTYTYTKEWSSRLIDSSQFKQSAEHQNPTSMPYESESWTARDVALGAYTLSESLIAQISASEALPVSVDSLPAAIRDEFKPGGEYLYRGASPSSPQIGDTRVRFLKIPEGPVSVVSQLAGNSFTSYTSKAGKSVNWLMHGLLTLKEMADTKKSEAVMLAWILRGVGLLCMYLGLVLFLRPIRVLADVLPIVGRIVGGGIGIVSFVIAFCLTVITICISWLTVRPLVAVPMLVAIGFIFYTLRKRKNNAALAAAGNGLPPPPPPT